MLTALDLTICFYRFCVVYSPLSISVIRFRVIVVTSQRLMFQALPRPGHPIVRQTPPKRHRLDQQVLPAADRQHTKLHTGQGISHTPYWHPLPDHLKPKHFDAIVEIYG